MLQGGDSGILGKRRDGHSTVWKTDLKRCAPVPIYGSPKWRGFHRSFQWWPVVSGRS